MTIPMYATAKNAMAAGNVRDITFVVDNAIGTPIVGCRLPSVVAMNPTQVAGLVDELNSSIQRVKDRWVSKLSLPGKRITND